MSEICVVLLAASIIEQWKTHQRYIKTPMFTKLCWGYEKNEAKSFVFSGLRDFCYLYAPLLFAKFLVIFVHLWMKGKSYFVSLSFFITKLRYIFFSFPFGDFIVYCIQCVSLDSTRLIIYPEIKATEVTFSSLKWYLCSFYFRIDNETSGIHRNTLYIATSYEYGDANVIESANYS